MAVAEKIPSEEQVVYRLDWIEVLQNGDGYNLVFSVDGCNVRYVLPRGGTESGLQKVSEERVPVTFWYDAARAGWAIVCTYSLPGESTLQTDFIEALDTGQVIVRHSGDGN